MKKLDLLILMVIPLTILSCQKDKNESGKNYEIKGFAQKGPYNSGTNITVSELRNSLQPTGLNYYSTVSNNMGSFIIPNVELSSHYVELMADGYYFNENFGITTDEKLFLKTVADVSTNSEININILTHISSERVKYLVQYEGKTFLEAKTQAQDEILKIFNMSGNDTANYEKLDISEEGELNSILLAISSIIQGDKSVPALTEFLANISTDIKKDGVIDSKELQTNLATSAALCDVGDIRAHLAKFYNNDTIFNNFQNYVKLFVETTEFESLIDLNFPVTTPEGVNLLAVPDNMTLDTATTYCISQNLNISNLSNFDIEFSILNILETGTISFSENGLANWNYDSYYCSNEPEGQFYGINIITYSINSASKTPLIIKFRGSGEVILKINIESVSLPDNGGYYEIRKHMKW